MGGLPYCKKPCAECPWRTDVKPGKFPVERFRVLAPTAYDMARNIFACHMSREGGEVACAGFVLQQGAHNLSLRMARQRFDVSSAAPLYDNYREMAIANGVDESDPWLTRCRTDGQTMEKADG
jgi:hypothetical protein